MNELKITKIKNIVLLFLGFLMFFSCGSNITITQEINTQLKKKLDEIYARDQGIRELIIADISKSEKLDLLKKLNLTEDSDYKREMRSIDLANLDEIEKIITEYGYPGIDIVGTPTNLVTFYVLQHSDKIEQYIPTIQKAVEKGDIPIKKFCLMQDRHLMQQGKEQIYGTQIRGQKNKTGEWVHFFWPIKDPENVNKRREKVGLKSIEEYAKNMELEYRVITLEDVQKKEY